MADSDDDDESEMFEKGQHFEDIIEAQRESPDRYASEGHTYTQGGSNDDLQNVERFMPRIVHHDQDQYRKPTFFQEMLAANNLSSDPARDTTLLNPTASTCTPRRLTPLQARRNTSTEQDNHPLTMPGWSPKPIQETQYSACGDNEGPIPSRPSVFDSIEEQEDFLKALESAVGPAFIETTEQVSQIATVFNDQHGISTPSVVQPSFTSLRGQDETSVQNESKEQSHPQQSFIQTTQYVPEETSLPPQGPPIISRSLDCPH